MPYKESLHTLDSTHVDAREFTPDLLVELDRQRPGSGAECEPEEVIDWWHFCAYASHIQELMKDENVPLSKTDRDDILKDFKRKLETDEETEKMWNYTLYAARMKKIGLLSKETQEKYSEAAVAHIEKLRHDTRENVAWYLAFYLGHLSSIKENVDALVNEEDWKNFTEEAEGLLVSNPSYDHNMLLSRLLINLNQVNPEKTQQLIRIAGVSVPALLTDLKRRLMEEKEAGKQRFVLQYLETLKALASL